MQTCQWEVPATWDGDPLAVPGDEYGPEMGIEDGGVDSSFSLEPDEMSELVKQTNQAFRALGQEGSMRSNLEVENIVFRRSLYFVKNINKDEVITPEHVRRIRPGYGLDAKFYDMVIGAKCIIPAHAGDRVTRAHFAKDNEN